MFDSLDINASALMAQRTRMDTVAGNVAGMNTTHQADGTKIPYRRRFVVFENGQANDPSKPGVHVSSVAQDQSPFRKVHEPGNPDADPDGWVQYPNVDLAFEQINMMDASRAYEANITMMETTKAMINSSLRLLA